MSNEELIVTSVKVNRKQGKLYHIYIEDRLDPIIVHEDIFIKYRLMKGQRLTSQIVDEIIEENGNYVAYEKSIRYLASRARSSEQIAQYLRNLQFREHHIASAVARLTHNGYVDDLLFAKQYVQSKSKTQGKGKLRIAQELKALGIAEPHIRAVLSEIDEDNEAAAAYEAACKKMKSLRGDKLEVSRKMMQFLLRRGYSGAISRKVMQRLEKESINDLQVDINGELLDN